MIVNSDDFGLSEATNRGIISAFERGVASSTSLMANQPRFEEAVELAHEFRLEQHVGVHLCLTSGSPLTDPIRTVGLFCDANGAFRAWQQETHIWRLEAVSRDAVQRELRAQIGRVRAAHLPVTHLDSHHHVHTEWALCSIVIGLALDLGVPYVRVARNCGAGIGAPTRIYKTLLNRRLRRAGLQATRWFGDRSDWLHLQAQGADDESLADFELMTHPLVDAEGRLVDSESESVELAELLAPVSAVGSARSFSGEVYARAGAA